jgi:hypothetical protein
MLIHPLPDPIAFSLGPVKVHWYGLMYVLAFALFVALGRVRIKQPHIAKLGWQNKDLDDMLFYAGAWARCCSTVPTSSCTIRWRFSQSGAAACPSTAASWA